MAKFGVMILDLERLLGGPYCFLPVFRAPANTLGPEGELSFEIATRGRVLGGMCAKCAEDDCLETILKRNRKQNAQPSKPITLVKRNVK